MGSNGSFHMESFGSCRKIYLHINTERKYFNIVEQLLDSLTGVGRPVAPNNPFPTISLL